MTFSTVPTDHTAVAGIVAPIAVTTGGGPPATTVQELATVLLSNRKLHQETMLESRLKFRASLVDHKVQVGKQQERMLFRFRQCAKQKVFRQNQMFLRRSFFSNINSTEERKSARAKLAILMEQETGTTVKMNDVTAPSDKSSCDGVGDDGANGRFTPACADFEIDGTPSSSSPPPARIVVNNVEELARLLLSNREHHQERRKLFRTQQQDMCQKFRRQQQNLRRSFFRKLSSSMTPKEEQQVARKALKILMMEDKEGQKKTKKKTRDAKRNGMANMNATVAAVDSSSPPPTTVVELADLLFLNRKIHQHSMQDSQAVFHASLCGCVDTVGKTTTAAAETTTSTPPEDEEAWGMFRIGQKEKRQEFRAIQKNYRRSFFSNINSTEERKAARSALNTLLTNKSKNSNNNSTMIHGLRGGRPMQVAKYVFRLALNDFDDLSPIEKQEKWKSFCTEIQNIKQEHIRILNTDLRTGRRAFLALEVGSRERDAGKCIHREQQFHMEQHQRRLQFRRELTQAFQTIHKNILATNTAAAAAMVEEMAANEETVVDDTISTKVLPMNSTEEEEEYEHVPREGWNINDKEFKSLVGTTGSIHKSSDNNNNNNNTLSIEGKQLEEDENDFDDMVVVVNGTTAEGGREVLVEEHDDKEAKFGCCRMEDVVVGSATGIGNEKEKSITPKEIADTKNSMDIDDEEDFVLLDAVDNYYE